MLHVLLELFDGEQGRDTMGVPLFHHECIWEIWRVQKNHVFCLKDPDGVQLYIQTGTIKKGSIYTLLVFRCARGSTLLSRFICTYSISFQVRILFLFVFVFHKNNTIQCVLS